MTSRLSFLFGGGGWSRCGRGMKHSVRIHSLSWGGFFRDRRKFHAGVFGRIKVACGVNKTVLISVANRQISNTWTRCLLFLVISCSFSCNGCQPYQISDIGLESVLYQGYFRSFFFSYRPTFLEPTYLSQWLYYEIVRGSNLGKGQAILFPSKRPDPGAIQLSIQWVPEFCGKAGGPWLTLTTI
jgi:hypothetical protein